MLISSTTENVIAGVHSGGVRCIKRNIPLNTSGCCLIFIVLVWNLRGKCWRLASCTYEILSACPYVPFHTSLSNLLALISTSPTRQHPCGGTERQRGAYGEVSMTSGIEDPIVEGLTDVYGYCWKDV